MPVIRRILYLTTGILFIILFFQGVFVGGYSRILLREIFDLDLLTKKGPLISQSFKVDKSTTYYELNFEKNTSTFVGDSLFLNVKLLNKKNKVINEFPIKFIQTANYDYRERWKQLVFKATEKQELRVVIKVLKNNMKKAQSAKNNYYLRFRVKDVDSKITMNNYYNVFIYAFFAMLAMIFIPNKWF